MFLITDMFYFPRGLQRVRSDKNSLLLFSFRLLLKSRPYCSVEVYSPSQSPTKTSYICPSGTGEQRFPALGSLKVYSSCFQLSFPSFRSSYTATLSSICFWIFLPSRIQSGEETDVRRQRLNHCTLHFHSPGSRYPAIWSPWEPDLTHRRSGCQLGLLSINFDFRNIIFQPIVFPSVWAKYKWNFMRDRCKLSFPLPLAAPLARAFLRDSFHSPK